MPYGLSGEQLAVARRDSHYRLRIRGQTDRRRLRAVLRRAKELWQQLVAQGQIARWYAQIAGENRRWASTWKRAAKKWYITKPLRAAQKEINEELTAERDELAARLEEAERTRNTWEDICKLKDVEAKEAEQRLFRDAGRSRECCVGGVDMKQRKDWWDKRLEDGEVVVPVMISDVDFIEKHDLNDGYQVTMFGAIVNLRNRTVTLPTQITWDSLLKLARVVFEARKYIGGRYWER